MRPDMAKVVTERPRVGHGNRSTKTARRLTADEIADVHSEVIFERYGDGEPEFDSGPTRFPVSRLGQCRFRKGAGECHKEFTDVLNPLRGYLRKQVGRPWAKVWSELSANLDKRSITGSHIFDHIRREVEQDCWKGVSGKVYSTRGNYQVDGLYVDQITHLLCYRKPPSRRWHPRHAVRQQFHRFGIDTWRDDWKRYRVADPFTLWEHTDHGWFIHTYVDVPERVEVFIRADGKGEVRRVHPAHVERVRSKQASRKEIRDARALLDKQPM